MKHGCRHEKRQDWAKLVKGSARKFRRRRETTKALLHRSRKKFPGPFVERSKVSARDKREDLFVLCTSISVEELVRLNHLEGVDVCSSFFAGIGVLVARYDFAEAYKRSLGRETQRVHERIVERFECLAFFLNLVLCSFHSGTGWLPGGLKRLLEIQRPPDDLVKARRRNERMAERGLNYYCWGIFLGDLRNLICLRADEDVPESLYGDRHHRPRIPYYANQLYNAGLCNNVSSIQPCVDSIASTWPVIPNTVTLQVILPLTQGKYWDLLNAEEKQRTQARLSANTGLLLLEVDTSSRDEYIGVTEAQMCAHRPTEPPSPVNESERHLQPPGEEIVSRNTSGFEMGDEPSGFESNNIWDPFPDLLDGTTFTSFVKPVLCAAPSTLGSQSFFATGVQTNDCTNHTGHDESRSGLMDVSGTDFFTC